MANNADSIIEFLLRGYFIYLGLDFYMSAADAAKIIAPPSVFISYTWESKHHVRWVEKLAYDIAMHGARVTLDRWNLAPGEQISSFMMHAIRKHDFIIFICTKKYKQKADGGAGGVAFETDLITSELAIHRNHKKFIPILASGTWKTAAPAWASGKLFIDMRDPADYGESMVQIRRAIFSEVPLQGPSFTSRRVTSVIDTKLVEIKSIDGNDNRVPFGGEYILPEVTPEEFLLTISKATQGKQVALVYCDVDGLLAINMIHGLEVGDRVMEVVSNYFSFFWRDHDVYRLIDRHRRRGGDQIIGFYLASDAADKKPSHPSNDHPIGIAIECVSSIEAFDWSVLAPDLFVSVTACVCDKPYVLDDKFPLEVLMNVLIDAVRDAKKSAQRGLQILDVMEAASNYRNLRSKNYNTLDIQKFSRRFSE